MKNVVDELPLLMVPPDGLNAAKNKNRPKVIRRYPTALNIIVILKTEIKYV